MEIKKKKEYTHIGPLMQNIIRKRLRDKIGMQKAAVMEAGDPRRISRNISKIPPPCTNKRPCRPKKIQTEVKMFTFE